MSNPIRVGGWGNQCDCRDQLYIKEDRIPEFMADAGMSSGEFEGFKDGFDQDMQEECPSGLLAYGVFFGGIVLGIVLALVVNQFCIFIGSLGFIFYAIRACQLTRVVNRSLSKYNRELFFRYGLLAYVRSCRSMKVSLYIEFSTTSDIHEDRRRLNSASVSPSM